MESEKNSDKILKRVLPALSIGVIYFVFISQLFTSTTEERRSRYQQLQHSASNPGQLMTLQQQQGRISAELGQLKRQQKQLRETILSSHHFLSHQQSISETIDQLVLLLEQNHLDIVEEKHDLQIPKEELLRSLREVYSWLYQGDQQAEPAAKPASAETQQGANEREFIELTYRGPYLGSLAVLSAIAKGQLQAIPVKISLSEEKNESGAGVFQLWALTLLL